MRSAIAALVTAITLTFCGPTAPVAAQVPTKAHQHLHTLRQQIDDVMPGFDRPHYFAGLIEHESCVTLTSPRCWSPNSRLKTDREEGAGLGQLTRAFTGTGRVRFDALADATRLDPVGLNELRWSTVYQRPDLQMRVIVLMTRSNLGRLQPLVPDPLPFADSAYNGGLGGVLNDRRACAARHGCDPDVWFGHVEGTCTKSTRPIYGSRSACDINRHHVRDVLINRMPKYRGLL